MTRGDVVTVALQGDGGKPRPALVLQSDLFGQLGSLTVLPITSTIIDAPLLRVTVEPSRENGLHKRSSIMIDKVQTPALSKVGPVIGHLETETMTIVNRLVTMFLGLA